MDRTDVQRWLDHYLEAWRENSRAPIEALFTDDVTYRFAPFGDAHTVHGLTSVVDAWLRQPDPPDSWEARYEPYAVDGDRAVAVGTSSYRASGGQPARLYHNVFLLRFAPDGRCAEFTELYMREESS
jgi:hypothetical protein